MLEGLVWVSTYLLFCPWPWVYCQSLQSQVAVGPWNMALGATEEWIPTLR